MNMSRCAGCNIRKIYEENPDNRNYGVGRILLALEQRDVKPVAASLRVQKIDRLAMYSRQITLTADIPPYPRAMEIADEARKYCGIDGTGWLNEVQRLLHDGVYQQTEKVEVQYFSLGNGCLCGVANEVMVEFALRVSELLHDGFFYFGAYTNGCTGYFPTEEEFDEGG